jgi:hypothetical protein
MLQRVPDFYFFCPSTPSGGAWALAVTLIARADLTRPSTYKMKMEEVFDLTDVDLQPRFIDEVVHHAAKFGFVTYEGNKIYSGTDYFGTTKAFKSNHLFAGLYFCGGYPGSVKAIFHSSALPFLRKLQILIHQLIEQGELTSSNLMMHMRNNYPAIILDMPAEPLYPSYLSDSTFCVRGVLSSDDAA